MSKLNEFVQNLEASVQKLFQKMDTLEQLNSHLKQQIQELEDSKINYEKQLELLQNEVKALKMSNSLLGSEEFKRDTKLKINALVKEIDFCIHQLSD
jgi:prefoldin subunit 5